MPESNRIYKENEMNYGDVRQAFDMWLNRANLPDAAELQIKDVQDALDRLSEFVK